MNISSASLLEARERDGGAAEERPEYVEEALTPDKRLGYRNGRPLVEPPQGIENDMRLGDDVTPLYEHYQRGESLLLPEASEFIDELFDSEHLESLADGAAELNTDKSILRKAAELHGVDVPTEGGSDDATETIDELEMPSGESIPLALLSDRPHTDKLVLAQLLSVGMGVEEIARYLSKERGERVTSAEVRSACQDANLLSGGGGGGGGTDVIPPRKRTVSADCKLGSSPW